MSVCNFHMLIKSGLDCCAVRTGFTGPGRILTESIILDRILKTASKSTALVKELKSTCKIAI